MANTVEQILTQTKSIITNALGADYQELRYIYDIEKNNLREARLAYGVHPLDAASADTVTCYYTLDHSFEIILTDTFARGDSDAQRETALNTMYNKADEIFKDMVSRKVNLPTLVLNVFEPGLGNPEFLDDNKFIVLRMGYSIKYRSRLDL